MAFGEPPFAIGTPSLGWALGLELCLGSGCPKGRSLWHGAFVVVVQVFGLRILEVKGCGFWDCTVCCCAGFLSWVLCGASAVIPKPSSIMPEASLHYTLSHLQTWIS